MCATLCGDKMWTAKRAVIILIVGNDRCHFVRKGLPLIPMKG